MKIGVDARMWRHTGIGRYVRELFPRIARQATVVAWVAPDELEEAREALPGIALLPCPAKIFSIAEQTFWWHELRGTDLDLFHAPHLNVPLAAPMPLITTLHDLIPMRFPGTINAKLGFVYFTFMANLAVRRADRVITVSEHTKRDAIALLGADDAKLRPVLQGVDAAFGVPADPARLAAMRARFGLTDTPYVLYAGQWKPYKNVELLIEAFASARAQQPTLKLVLLGRIDETQPHVLAAVRRLALEDAVVTTGYVADDEDVVALYQAATLLAFPSRYEGFGLPPLEAMAAGVPVISSDAASLPEVVGDAGLLLSPDDEAGWAEAIARVASDKGLRDRMIQRGYTRAQSLTWDATATATLAVYRETKGHRHEQAQ